MEGNKVMRPFSSRDEGRVWFMGFLLKKGGFSDVRPNPDRYGLWDVSGTREGETYLFELKNRDFCSDRYGDVSVEEAKVKRLLATPYKVILVYFWEDVWTMINLRATPYPGTIKRPHRKTTRYERDYDVNTPWARWPLDTIKVSTY